MTTKTDNTPTDIEILSLAYDVGSLPEQMTDEGLCRFARALLSRYSSSQPATSAKPLCWVPEDELPASLPSAAYDALYPHSRVDGIREFPVFGPTSAVAEPYGWLYTESREGTEGDTWGPYFTKDRTYAFNDDHDPNPIPVYAAPVAAQPTVDMGPPATSRDRWMYEQGRLAERDPRTAGSLAAQIAAQPSVPDRLPYWEPCNPGCDPEFNGERSLYCAQLCEGARKALAAAPTPPADGQPYHDIPEDGYSHRAAIRAQQDANKVDAQPDIPVWTERHNSTAIFALWRLMNDAYANADRAKRDRALIQALERCLDWLPEDCAAACEARAVLGGRPQIASKSTETRMDWAGRGGPVLTDCEIMSLYNDGDLYATLAFARAIESAVLAKLKDQS